MTNSLFDNESLALLQQSASWRLICSVLPAEVDFIADSQHRNWMRSHTESHPAREILVALKGSGIYGFQGKSYPCTPGTIILFDSYESHDSFYPQGSPDMVHLWIALMEHDIMGHISRIGGHTYTYHRRNIALTDHRAAEFMTAIWNELKQDEGLPAPFRRAKLCAALSSLLMACVEQGYRHKSVATPPDFQGQVIEAVCRHVAHTAGCGVPLSEAARLSGYSKFHFLRLFKQKTGQTFHDYINQCRRKKVVAMRREHRSKTEIAQALGFSHLSTFLRWLKSQSL